MMRVNMPFCYKNVTVVRNGGLIALVIAFDMALTKSGRKKSTVMTIWPHWWSDRKVRVYCSLIIIFIKCNLHSSLQLLIVIIIQITIHQFISSRPTCFSRSSLRLLLSSSLQREGTSWFAVIHSVYVCICVSMQQSSIYSHGACSLLPQ